MDDKGIFVIDPLFLSIGRASRSSMAPLAVVAVSAIPVALAERLVSVAHFTDPVRPVLRVALAFDLPGWRLS